jgi:hypothetical protein
MVEFFVGEHDRLIGEAAELEDGRRLETWSQFLTLGSPLYQILLNICLT